MNHYSWIIDRLENVTQKGDNRWRATCPAHDDQHPSLDILVGNKGLVIICRAGCDTASILNAIDVKWCQLFHDYYDDEWKHPMSEHRKIIKVYPYQDETLKTLYEKVRYEPKNFACRHDDPAGKDGKSWMLPPGRRVLYQLPLILTRKDAVVWVVEGEKDADRLTSLGIVATTNVEGSSKWLPEYSRCLRGRTVVIVPDHDRPGYTHAYEVAGSLLAHRVSGLRLLRLPDQPDHGDVSDWLDGGRKLDDLLRAEQAADLWCVRR